MWHILCRDFNSCRRILKDFFVIKVEPEQFPCPQSCSLSLSPLLSYLLGVQDLFTDRTGFFFFPPHLPGATSAHATGSCFVDAMLWLQQNKCSKYLELSSLPFSFWFCFFSFYLPDCVKQSPKRLSESPGFAWWCRKIEIHPKTPFPAQLPSQSWIRTSLWWPTISFPG